MSATRKAIFFRTTIIVIWVALFAALMQRDFFIKTLDMKEDQIIKRSKEETFMGIYFKQQRIGYVRTRIAKNDKSGFDLQQESFLRLNILDQNHPIRMKVKAELSPKMLLENFTFNLQSPFYHMEARGEVNGKTVAFALTTGKEEITDRIRLASRPFLATNHRAYLLKEGLNKGDKFKVPYFDPISLAGQDTVMEYLGREKTLISGRIYSLHRFTESFSGLKINTWLDDQGKVIKEESPAGFVFISEPEFKATDLAVKGKEILSSVSVPISGQMPDLADLKSISYKLTFPDEIDFTLDKDRQSLAGDVLTITLETLPEAQAQAQACDGPRPELDSTPYIQAGNEKISKLARSLTENLPNDPAKVRALAQWVYDNLEKRPVLGIPDALTTLNSKRGDCNEHAALFTALARSIKIPTRVASGVTFHQGAFYYHAWNEVCLDNKWLSLDTTKNQIPADITHIKFVEGEIQEQIKIGALLGKLKIEMVEPKR